MIERRGRYRRGAPQRRVDDLAWAAGLCDGESTLRFSNGTPQVKIDMLYLPCLERMQALLGGSLKPVTSQSTRQMHRWQVSGDTARTALRRLLPLLVEKADQAAILLAIVPNGRGRRLSDAQHTARREAVRHLIQLKRINFPAEGGLGT